MSNNIEWEVVPLFSKPLGFSTTDEEVSSQLKDLCSKVVWEDDGGSSSGYKGGWSKERFVLNQHENLKQKILDQASSCIKNIYQYETDIQITTSWFVKTLPNGYTTNHSHCNSWFSGIIYFDSYEDSTSQLVLQRDSPRILTNKIDNLYNSDMLNILPKHGMMVLFPSEVRHHTTPNNSEHVRYCLSFNLMPKGEIGIGDSTFIY